MPSVCAYICSDHLLLVKYCSGCFASSFLVLTNMAAIAEAQRLPLPRLHIRDGGKVQLYCLPETVL